MVSPFDLRVRSPAFKNPFSQGNGNGKRSLGIRDKKNLYVKCHRKCGACQKKLNYDEMQVGHRTAWSKGGKTTFNNSVALCWSCNNNMGTQKYESYMKKMGWKIPPYLQKVQRETKGKRQGTKRPVQRDIFGNPIRKNPFGF